MFAQAKSYGVYTLCRSLLLICFVLPTTAVAMPDMIVGAPTVSDTSPAPDQSFTLAATVSNQGTSSSPPTTLRYFQSTDAVITTGDFQIDTDPVGQLSADGTSQESEAISLSVSGVYWLGACVDSVFDEASTTNNCSAAVQVTVSAAGAIDLTVAAVSVSRASLSPAETVSASATVRNVGTVSSPATTLRFYLSNNAIISGQDTQLSTFSVPSLLGSDFSRSTSVAAPNAFGNYWIGACVDNVANEINEFNNCNSVAITVSRPAPTGVTATDGEFVDKVGISWNTVAGASSYRVFRCTSTMTDSCSLLLTSTSMEADDTDGTPGVVYDYRVQSCVGTSCSDYSSGDSGYRQISPPNPVSASAGGFTDRIRIGWATASGATRYDIYLCANATAASCIFLATDNASPYDDFVNSGSSRLYRIKACSETSCSAFSQLARGLVPVNVAPINYLLLLN